MALKFVDVHAMFVDDNCPRGLRCIATPNSNRCINLLDDNQLLNLRDLLHSTSEPISLGEVREVMDCLICAYHQRRRYDHKKKVDQAWQSEFPHLDLASPRSRSRYSLHSGRATPRRSIGSSPSTPTRQVLTPSSMATNGSVSLSPPLPLSNLDTHRMRSISAPTLVGERLLAGSDSSPAVYVNDVADYFDQAPPESPLANRRRPHSLTHASESRIEELDRQRQADSVTNSESVCEPEHTVTQQKYGMGLVPRRNPINGSEPAPIARQEQAKGERSPARSGRFENGEASKWAPWTIRSASLELLRQSIPHPKDKGSIYAIEVVHPQRTITKIGITYQSVGDRLKQISSQHKQSFNEGSMFHRSGIPALELERLERLVHSDLAYFQRNWLVPTNESHKTHHEYFEVDLKTAQETIDLWRSITRSIDLKPGTRPNDQWFASIGSDPELEVCASTESDSVQAWKRINENHDRRTNFWKQHLAPKYSIKTKLLHKAAWWICGSIVLWLRFDMNNQIWYMLLTTSLAWEAFEASRL